MADFKKAVEQEAVLGKVVIQTSVQPVVIMGGGRAGGKIGSAGGWLASGGWLVAGGGWLVAGG